MNMETRHAPALLLPSILLHDMGQFGGVSHVVMVVVVVVVVVVPHSARYTKNVKLYGVTFLHSLHASGSHGVSKKLI
ncbi:hypothetical protein E2C01_043102 [Portunus trituberculatus]|uniref:Uncharacterized protein n=1 Tax=Portunus trituberculatus TaxID=210409 RepID=A0A5B7FYG9_PORTR|nr:hypothetical protein [Portunus trituberculatus]